MYPKSTFLVLFAGMLLLSVSSTFQSDDDELRALDGVMSDDELDKLIEKIELESPKPQPRHGTQIKAQPASVPMLNCRLWDLCWLWISSEFVKCNILSHNLNKYVCFNFSTMLGWKTLYWTIASTLSQFLIQICTALAFSFCRIHKNFIVHKKEVWKCDVDAVESDTTLITMNSLML